MDLDMSANAADILAEKRRRRSIRKTVWVETDVDVELYAEDFNADDIAELFDIKPPPDFNIEKLYYATRGDVWSRETHRTVQDLLAAMAGRAS
jgi:hypothetical protein